MKSAQQVAIEVLDELRREIISFDIVPEPRDENIRGYRYAVADIFTLINTRIMTLKEAGAVLP